MDNVLLKDKLIQFIQENKKVCPKPQKWNEFWNLLQNKRRNGTGWIPPLPLILAAWWETNDLEKRERLISHINYANEENVLDEINNYLRNLSDDDWIYEDEV